MNRAFTKREKVMLVILAVLIIGIGYLKLLLEPINAGIENYQQMEAMEQDQILLNASLVQQKRQMEQELQELFESGDPSPIPTYDNSANLLVELHKILEGSAEYTLNFTGTNPMDVQYLVGRPVNLTFRTASYPAARRIIDKLHDSTNINSISDLSIQFNSGHDQIIYWNESTEDSSKYPIVVSLTITYYERTQTK